MSPLDKDEVSQGRTMGMSFFKLSSIQPGQSQVIEVVEINKKPDTKYPIRGKDYCYRLTLADGRICDVNSIPVAGHLLRILYPENPETFVRAKVKITRKPSNKIGETPYEVDKG